MSRPKFNINRIGAAIKRLGVGLNRSLNPIAGIVSMLMIGIGAAMIYLPAGLIVTGALVLASVLLDVARTTFLTRRGH